MGLEAVKESMSLLSMEELAKYVGRHPQIVRKYFAEGLLPEPAHSVKFKRKTTRKFTLQEAERIKLIFDGVGWGTFAKKREQLKKYGKMG
jgi:hypothetical protein